MPLPLTVSCSSKIQIGFTFLVPAHPGSPGQRDKVCVCVVEPTILAKIEKTLTNDSLADVVLDQSLICLKEDWMKCVSGIMCGSHNYNNLLH